MRARHDRLLSLPCWEMLEMWTDVSLHKHTVHGCAVSLPWEEVCLRVEGCFGAMTIFGAHNEANSVNVLLAI